jgi:hypothetical protein
MIAIPWYFIIVPYNNIIFWNLYQILVFGIYYRRVYEKRQSRDDERERILKVIKVLKLVLDRDAATFTFLVVVCCFFHRWLLVVWKQPPLYLPVLFLNNHKQPPTTLIGIAGTTTNLQNRNSRKN